MSDRLAAVLQVRAIVWGWGLAQQFRRARVDTADPPLPA